jgi:hypothetical protein
MGWLLLTLVVAGMVGSQYVARSADTTETAIAYDRFTAALVLWLLVAVALIGKGL